MSTITTIAASDVISSSRAVINSNFAALNADKVEGAAALATAGAVPWVSAAGALASDPTKIRVDPATGALTVPAGFMGNAATATRLAAARTIAGVAFDGTANIAIASTGLSDSAMLVRTSGSYAEPPWLTSIAVASVRLTGLAEPVANAGNEGLMVYVKGTPGVSGSLRVCAQLTDGSYAWVPLF